MPTPDPDQPDVTALLHAWQEGDDAALAKLLPHIYGELHRIASRQRRGEHSGHTLDTTALLHEAYLRLVGSRIDLVDRTHFYAIAARTMRRVLVDHARTTARVKRGGGAIRVPLNEEQLHVPGNDADLIDLDEAIERLTALDERKGRVIELHYFGGLNYDQTGEVLGISPATVHRDLRMARAWLARELGADEK